MTWYNAVDDDVEVWAHRIAGNWRHFESFAWDGRNDEGAEESAIIYLSHRDSDLLDKSNEAAILDALSEFIESGDVRTESHRHWAVGYVDGIVIRVIRDGKATDAIKALHELAEKLETYPVLDDDDFSERECEASDEAWENFGASDFRSELAKLAPHHTEALEVFPSGYLRTIWDRIADNRGTDHEIHEGGGVYFPFDHALGAHYGRRAMTWSDVRNVILDIKSDVPLGWSISGDARKAHREASKGAQ